MIVLQGYRIAEQLYESETTQVYRGQRQSDQMPVAIKVLRTTYPSFSDLVKFRNQYAISRSLNSAKIVQPYTLETYLNGYALVMEDFGGISLREYVFFRERGIGNGEQGIGNGERGTGNGEQDWGLSRASLPLGEFLPIAIQLAEILEELYQKRVIHKDIKPTNILIHPETKQVKLIDFSIASMLPKEVLEIQNPNVLAGTLAYLAPEQTGRMNRGIDYRTDFYSLGVTFYELLAGDLPFPSNDPIELVHCHIARMPLPLGNGKQGTRNGTDMPTAISDIVMKLMAKNAEDRYQSALGLKYDLETCLQQWNETGEIESFSLGERDICDRFLIAEKLYGREQEVQILLDAFNRITGNPTSKNQNPKSSMVLVAGFSGVGKTAVVNEIHKPIVRQHGYFIKGKFDQFQRNIPFSAFVQALRDLMGQLLSEGKDRLEGWRTKILSAVGENGQVMIEVIPELANIIGPQPAVAALSGSEAQNRFNLIFQRFIQVFTTPERPLVLFLDDLQWADSASLNLIKLLMSEAETTHLLLLGAYRDNEVFPAHPLMLTLEDIKHANVALNTITLVPLNQADINRWVADTLSCSLYRAQPLTDLVYRKTKGNPFFTAQFLTALYNNRIINFDVQTGHWQCDIAQVKAQTLTDDVVEFMALQLQKLSENTQNILKLAACIGNQFDLATLAVVSEQSQADSAASLWQALQEGLILPTSEIYKFYQEGIPKNQAQCYEYGQLSASEQEQLNIQYKFLHDRVQQAAYSLILNNQKQLTHYKIGQLLLANTSEKEREERLFEIVNQLNYGIDIVSQSAERYDLACLNLRAGQKATQSTAYTAAANYFTYGMELLAVESWESQYTLTFNLHKERAEAEYLQGNFEQSEKIALETLDRSQSVFDRAEVYSILIAQYTILAQYKEAIEAGKKVLDAFNVRWSEDNLATELELELSEIENNLGDRAIASLIELPEMQDPSQKSAVKLLHALLTPAFSSNQQLGSLLVAKIVNLSLQHGHIPECCFGYAFYGTIVSMMLGNYQAGYEFGLLSLNLSKRFNNRAQETRSCNILAAFLLHWKKHIKCCEEFNNIGYQVGLESGQFQFVGYIAYNRLLSLFHSGRNLEDLSQDIPIYLPLVNRIQHYYAAEIMSGLQLAICNLIGTFEDRSLFQTDEVNEEKYLQTCRERELFPAICIYQILKAQLLYLYNQLDDALQAILLAKEHLDLVLGHFSVAEHNYYHSLILLRLFDTESREKQAIYLEQVQANQAQMKIWVENCPENFHHKYVLVEAERARTGNNPLAAVELYDRAIALLKDNEFVQDLALANELAGQFYLSWGKERIAQDYMTDAYYGYARWGAKAKVEALEQHYANLLAPILHASQGQSLRSLNPGLSKAGVSESTLFQVTTTSSEISAELDLATVLKASQALSKEIQLDSLVATLLQVVLENAGAEKCVLMLLEGNHLVVNAIATLDGQRPIALQSIPIDHSQEIPIRLINRVQNSLQPVVIMDATAHSTLAADPYIQQQQPKSLLCLPILHQGKLLGTLYLENRIAAAAFSRDRVELLNLLCSQAAISLENARLYQHSQAYASQLEQSLQDLQAAQTASADNEHALQEQALALVQLSQSEALSRGDLHCALQELTEVTARTLQVERVSVWLFDAQRSKIQCAALFELSLQRHSQGLELAVTDYPNYCAAIESQPILAIDDARTDPRTCEFTQGYLVPLEIHSMLDSGFQLDGKVGGVICCEQTGCQRHWKLAEQTFVRSVAHLVSLIVESNRRQQQAQTLQHAFSELEQAQLQIVQNEKMSALGNLVAGVAHEINNPVGCIAGNLAPIQEYLQDLLGLIDLYQQKYPQSDAAIAAEIEAIDLDFLRQDADKLIASMQASADRIASISTSLRTFSRTDKDYKVPFNLHEGIESTLLILKHRLKANDERPAIEIIKAYGDLPEVQCYPGQLNQVLMNLLANAVDALDEASKKHSYAEIEANSNRITIQTSQDCDRTIVRIRDNGTGMTEAVSACIFEPSFTTKAVGKGTGLGLAIARQIIEEKHSGTLTCTSAIGKGTEFVIELPIS